jgi:hypothetical protein
MPPIGPNFTKVAVGLDDHDRPAMFVNGRSDSAKAEKSIDVTWVKAEDVADGNEPMTMTLRSEDASHRLAPFDPNGGTVWTITVTEGERPEVNQYVLLMGVATMPPDGDGPATIRWSQTLKVDEA